MNQMATAAGIFCSAVVLLCLCLTGCASRSVEPLGSGYEEVTYTRNSISEPSAHQIALQYRDANGKQTMVWPSLYGVKEVIKGDVAIFVGNIADEPPLADEPRGTMPRLFAVRGAGPPLDITKEVLWHWSQKPEKNFGETLEAATASVIDERGDVLEFNFAIWPNTRATIPLSWNQISDIMREVKEKGVVKKDRVLGTSYIQEEFKP